MNDEGLSDGSDWLHYAPWNRQLLCSDCQEELAGFERERELFSVAGFPGGVMNPEDEEESEEEGDPLNIAISDFDEPPSDGTYHILVYSDGTSSVSFVPANDESDEDVIDVTSDTDVESVDSVTTVAP
jgi:hypothetical protein